MTPIRRGVLRALGFLCALVLLLGVAALVVFRTDLLLASLDVAASVPYRRGLPSEAGRRRAFFTWGDPPTATSAYDQIVVWHEGGQVVRMDTTGHDITPFIVARVEWDGRVELGGFVLPRRAAVYNDGRDGAVVHAWALISAEFTPK